MDGGRAGSCRDRGDSPDRPPAVIPDDAVFILGQLLAALPFLTRNSIRREVREGRLVPSRVCGHYLFLGIEVKRWIAAAQVRRKGQDGDYSRPADDEPGRVGRGHKSPVYVVNPLALAAHKNEAPRTQRTHSTHSDEFPGDASEVDG
jgi:hypothetical protein